MKSGERIKKVRLEKGITQTELAQKLGIPYQSIGQWERGIRNPKRETLQKIADALDVELWELLGDRCDPIRAVDPSETNTEREKRLGLSEGAISDALRVEDVEKQNKADMMAAMDKLNIPGQKEAVKRVQELGFVDEYKRRSLSDIWGYDKPTKNK